VSVAETYKPRPQKPGTTVTSSISGRPLYESRERVRGGALTNGWILSQALDDLGLLGGEAEAP
jgi:hypothetical protein